MTVPTVMSYTHQAMIDLLIAKPTISLKEAAALFGYTPGWLNRLFKSDAFQEMLEARKKELADPVLMQGIQKRLEALLTRSIDVLEEKMDSNPSADVALKAIEVAQKGLGLGAAKAAPAVSVSFVVAMPPKAESPTEWARQYNPRPPVIVDATPTDGGS